MTENECLNKMVAPGTQREGIWRKGVLQVWVTRACDKSCFSCTQGSNLAGKPEMISVEHFEQALLSLKGYFGVIGMFGGNPATSPHFEQLCSLMRTHVPHRQRGIWCNNPITVEKAGLMRGTFDPSVSNLNVHLDQKAYDLFSEGWPECRPFLKGMDSDSRHAPLYVAMKDVIPDEGERRRLISDCDINKYWSAMIGVFRGQLRAWFCEIAGAQAMLHQHEPDYPDTGLDPTAYYETETSPGVRIETVMSRWWQLPMTHFADQVRKHCHDCGIPLRGYGELAMGGEKEQVSETHAGIYKPKVKGRSVELVTVLVQVGKDSHHVERSTDYIGNSTKGPVD